MTRNMVSDSANVQQPSNEDETIGLSNTVDAAPGKQFGDYELIEEIDRGGMGVVYKARQTQLNRIVALKMIKSGQLASPQEVERFHLEAQAAASIEHPGIVSIHEVGQCNGMHFFSMQLIEGESLATKLTKHAMSIRDVATLMMKVAKAVAYAHSRGVIHRDLKPANVLIDSDGEPKITDFGLAKRTGGGSNLTETGQILGTPAYMAPEQATGDRHEVTELADVYSLGAMLYALCTGRAPFQATNEIDVLLQVLDSEPTLPSRINRQMPKALERICMRCLEKKAARRYPSADALASDLEHFLRDEPVDARTGDFWQLLRRWARREPALAAHLGALLVFLATLQATFHFVGEDLSYHLTLVKVLAAWAVLSVALQTLLNRRKWREIARYSWVTADAILLTLVLTIALPPRGPLLVGYPVLIAAAGMFARTRLVAFTTGVCSLGYLALLFLRPEEASRPQFCVFFGVGLIVVGSLIAAQVRRVRSLRRFYEVDVGDD